MATGGTTTKYHIAPNGPMLCEAQIRDCPYAKNGGKHYGNIDKAEQVWREQMEAEHGVLATTSRADSEEIEARLEFYRAREKFIAQLKKKRASKTDQKTVRTMRTIHNLPPVPPPPGAQSSQLPPVPPPPPPAPPAQTPVANPAQPTESATPPTPRIPVTVSDGMGVRPPRETIGSRFRGMLKRVSGHRFGRSRRLGTSAGDRKATRQVSNMRDARDRRPLTPAQIRRQRVMDSFARGVAQRVVKAEKAVQKAYDKPGHTVYKYPSGVQMGDVDTRHGSVIGIKDQGYGRRSILFEKPDGSRRALLLNHDYVLHLQGRSMRQKVDQNPILRGAKRSARGLHWIFTAEVPHYDKYDKAWSGPLSRAHQNNPGRKPAATQPEGH